MQRFVIAAGGLIILGTFFFGTLHFLDSLNYQSLDTIRAEHAKTLKTAVEMYRSARGKYPSPFPDNDIADLKPELVDGAFIRQLPVDPYWKNGRVNKYRYRSDGATYGILFYMELGPCQTGTGVAAINPWDGRSVPTCPF